MNEQLADSDEVVSALLYMMELVLKHLKTERVFEMYTVVWTIFRNLRDEKLQR
jgi:hypothetical protein